MIMRFHVVTIFPEMFDGLLDVGVLKRAINNRLIEVNLTDIRDFTTDKHRSVDDYQFGGGSGMLLKPDPLFKSVESIQQQQSLDINVPVILMSPQGRTLSQKIVEDLSRFENLVLICGRYEGVDERVREHLVTDEISIGDYVLSGGELAAMVLIETISRLIPGVLGSIESAEDDSFTSELLQNPQYTRPSLFRDWSVPEVLLSGDHKEIEKWRRQEALRRTHKRRPDLLDKNKLTKDELNFIKELDNNSI
tara:strand:+ start:7110 stop:7859 length:750 start_codon:yes stop_codon:yes gene_type:complete